MGGYGSGRQWGKDTTNSRRPLDIRELHRDGLLTPGRVFSWNWLRNGETVASIQIRIEAERLILNYRSQSDGGEWQAMEYPVYLEWTPCTLGGRRAWFRCPAQGCGRRVAILYSGTVFACRHCYQLAYPSQRETWDDRAARRAGRIRDKLGWEPGLLNGNGWKPKGMHWRTFERWRAAHDALVNASLMGMSRRFKMKLPGLE